MINSRTLFSKPDLFLTQNMIFLYKGIQSLIENKCKKLTYLPLEYWYNHNYYPICRNNTWTQYNVNKGKWHSDGMQIARLSQSRFSNTGNSRCPTRHWLTILDCSRSTLGSQKISSNTTYFQCQGHGHGSPNSSKVAGRALWPSDISSIAILRFYKHV